MEKGKNMFGGRRAFLKAGMLASAGLTLVGRAAAAENPTASAGAVVKTGEKEPVEYVNTTIGNVSHLLVPTRQNVQLPFGMMRANVEKFDGAAQTLEGLPFFMHAHRFGTPLRFTVFINEQPRYFFDAERASPYDYSLFLRDDRIGFDFAVSRRSAVYELDFSRAVKGSPKLLFTDKFGIEKISVSGASVDFSYALKNGVKIFAAADFDSPPESVDFGKDSLKITFPRIAKLKVKYGVSFIDAAQARKNLDADMFGFDIEKIKADGRAAWNAELSRVKISSGDENAKAVFYTAFWRTFERMMNIDEQGRYYNFYTKSARPSIDGKYFYTDDWSWDTYRTMHPLKSLLMPRYEERCLESILEYARTNPDNWIPKFMSADREYTYMNGNHILASFLDADQKGLKVNLGDACKYGRKTINEKTLLADREGPAGELSKFYAEHGYVPAIPDETKETSPEGMGWARRQAVSVSTALYFDDWCLSQIAEKVGDKETAAKFAARAANYKMLFNPKTKFFDPKDADGKFIKIGDHLTAGGQAFHAYYTENSAYVYRFDAEHDIGGLMKLYGGRDAFEKALDETFAARMKTAKYRFLAAAPDNTAIIGGFSAANEPAFRIPYLYNCAGAPWKAQCALRHIIDTWFRNDIMGIPGDEDGGAMSAFVVFTMLGFYPVNVGRPIYEFGTPFFDEAEIEIPDIGKKIRISARGASAKNKYVRSVKIDGKPYNKYWISHKDFVGANHIEFEMGDTPNYSWAADKNALPENVKSAL